MENPATWGKAEKVIVHAINDHNKSRKEGVVGLSLVRCIADALREAGLLRSEEEAGTARAADIAAAGGATMLTNKEVGSWLLSEAWPTRRVADLPPVNQDCSQCRDDEGSCTCTERCQSIVCARGPWDGTGTVSR